MLTQLEVLIPAAAGNPIGFSGLALNAITSHYANSDVHYSCLYQLVRCVFALRTVTPRTLGALTGFFVGAISTSGNSACDPGALMQTLQGIPVAGNQKDLLDALRMLGGNTPKSGISGTHLGTLCRVGDEMDRNAFYLDPLTGHLYDTVSPVFGMTYVSWIVYLLKHLKQGLENLMADFRRIDCQQSGCERGQNGRGVMACADGSCQPGTHGYECKCDSIVSCRGVHSVLYRYGFSYAGWIPKMPNLLAETGTSKKQDAIKCTSFYQKIQDILTGKPSGQSPVNLLDNLLTAVRQYKYQCRMPFGLYIGVYWTAVLVYLLWSLGGPLDLMHIKTRWKSSSSHQLPVQRLLSNGSFQGDTEQLVYF